MDIAHFDLAKLPDEFYQNPYPTYRELQNEAPILTLPDASILLTRYDDINAVYRDAHTFSSDKRSQFGPVFGVGCPLFEHHTTSLVFNDPPLHTRVRRAIGNALSQRVVTHLRRDVEQLIAELLDRLPTGEPFDLISSYAAAIPVEVIGNLLAIPKAERAPLRQWSLDILGALEVGLAPDALARGNRSVAEFLDYLEHHVATRRQEAHADDIIARLLRAGTLSAAELYHQCIFLLNAGHETTTNLIANGVELLLRHPESLAALASTPTLITSAVEEMLRFESPNQLGNRTTTEETAIAGIPIPANTVLTLVLGAANRDPHVFADPETFDIQRTPNPHLAFAAGIHTCAGLNVARLEGRIAISALFAAMPNLRIVKKPERNQRARFRGFSQLWVANGSHGG